MKKLNLVVLFLICGWMGWQQFQIVQLKKGHDADLTKLRGSVHALSDGSGNLWGIVSTHADLLSSFSGQVSTVEGQIRDVSSDIGTFTRDIRALKSHAEECDAARSSESLNDFKRRNSESLNDFKRRNEREQVQDLESRISKIEYENAREKSRRELQEIFKH